MPFNAFNAFPEFPDQFKPPSPDISNEESWEIYEPRCYPSIEQIIERVEAVRAVNPGLHTVYVLSNAPRKWVDGLFDRMRLRHTWRLMGQSRDLQLTTEQRYIAQTVDMLIAQRAEVLIGNGVSDLSRATKDNGLLIHATTVFQPDIQCRYVAYGKRFTT